MSDPHELADRGSPNDPRETDVSSEVAELTGIQIDGYKIKAHIRPVETGEPTPKTWAEVWQSVHAKLKLIAVNLVGVVEDAVVGTRKLLRGLAEIPAATARRIDRAHEKADREESIRQEKVESKVLPPPPPEDAMDCLKGLLLGLQANGVPVEIRDLGDGRQAIVIVKPEDRQIAAKLAAKALPGPGQAPAKKKRRSLRKPETPE